MFWTRLASGIVLVAVTIALMVNGGWPLFWVVTAISLIGLFELYRVADLHKTPPAVIGFISSVVLDILILDGYYEYLILWLILTLMVMMACYVIAYPKYHTDQMTLLFFGLVYVTIMMSFIFKVRYLEGGILTVWLIFVASWGSDTCAYCAGMLFGRHKLAPVLSPKKSIEGAIGGVVGAALLGALYGMVFGTHMDEVGNPVIVCSVACAIAAVISQIGDLAASAIKRNHQVKDYGTLIPGHGGILDRFDSMMFTAPAIYFAILFLR